MNTSASSRRQALFAHFSHRAIAELADTNDADRPLVMLTGGLATADLMASALQNKHADLLGIGRLSVLHPRLPEMLQNTMSVGTDTDLEIFSNGPLAKGVHPWEIPPTNARTKRSKFIPGGGP